MITRTLSTMVRSISAVDQISRKNRIAHERWVESVHMLRNKWITRRVVDVRTHALSSTPAARMEWWFRHSHRNINPAITNVREPKEIRSIKLGNFSTSRSSIFSWHIDRSVVLKLWRGITREAKILPNSGFMYAYDFAKTISFIKYFNL